MNKNINLCEILKGHEGETFYSIYYGNVKLIEIKDEFLIFQISSNMTNVITTINGKSIYTYELDIVPSEDQRDWIKWDKENNHKTLKTWSDLVASDEYKKEVNKVDTLHWYGGNTPIEKAVLALFKIYQLIEVSYGGNVSYERCSSIKYENVFKIAPCGLRDSLKFDIIEVDGEHSMNHIMFHTKEQAEEFLSYPENVQLLKDYFMI